MSIKIKCIAAGMTMTNSYLVCDEATKQAVAIDPGWEGDRLLEEAKRAGWTLNQIWLTHAHFDHLGAVGTVANAFQPPLPVAMHPDDQWLWDTQGGAVLFGIQGIDPGPKPSIHLKHGQILSLGESSFQVRHAPGHTPGHVMFYNAVNEVLFCGDVIFRSSIGRTDLPRGDYNTLITSIREQVLTLPDEARLLSGHGPETSVGIERESNPFL